MRLLFQGYRPHSEDVYAGPDVGVLNRIFRPLLPGLILISMYINIPILLTLAYRMTFHGLLDPLGLLMLAILLVVALVPLDWFDNKWGHGFMEALLSSLGHQMDIHVVLEDEDAIKPGHPYIIGIEPHSSLPLSMPAVFGHSSPFMPKALRGACYALTSTVCLHTPFVRQLFYLAGARPASRTTMQKLLAANKVVVLVPGGVQECLYMTHENELAFLKSRKGFVKVALQTGAALIPVFSFNQGKAFTWYRLGPPVVSASIVNAMARYIGFAPIAMWGWCGTTIPHRCHVTTVMGRPIEVPKLDGAEPSPEMVEEYLQEFITELVALFERHKKTYGSEAMRLDIM